ncbi:heme O synthase-like polyprenyltransferase [Streptomyces sp. B1I3]|nr:heme O synthase-like polyprenyltransferase [Streptomyces sp. B1I3]
MTEFLTAALAFPAVLFGAALVVVVCFWLLVAAGVAEHHAFDTDLDADSVGLGGVPVAVSVSLVVVVSWCTSLTGSVLVLRSGVTGTVRAALHVVLLAGALLIAWRVTRVLVRRFRRRLPAARPPARQAPGHHRAHQD